MLKELYEAIGQQAVKALAPAALYPDREPDHIYWTRAADGTLDYHEADPEPRQHQAGDLSAVIAFAQRFSVAAAVWYDRDGVVCITDDDRRRDRVALPLAPSPQLATVKAMEPKKPFDQRELILLLRTTFADCLGCCPGFVDLLRTVKFKSKTDGESTVKHGQRSVGKAIEQQIEGTAELPEYVELLVPVFGSGFAANATVRLALDPDPTTEKFWLIPLPGTIEDAFAYAEDRIGDRLRDALKESDVPVYYGDPALGSAD